MTKNISVIDMQGNVYEATYLKRAKGLVKKGRARFVNESTICLACPPYQTEDNKMDINADKISNEVIQGLPDSEKGRYLSEILQRIGSMLQDTSYIEAALGQLGNVTDSEDAIGLIGDIVKARETTNQKAIDTLGALAAKLV